MLWSPGFHSSQDFCLFCLWCIAVVESFVLLCCLLIRFIVLHRVRWLPRTSWPSLLLLLVMSMIFQGRGSRSSANEDLDDGGDDKLDLSASLWFKTLDKILSAKGATCCSGPSSSSSTSLAATAQVDGGSQRRQRRRGSSRRRRL